MGFDFKNSESASIQAEFKKISAASGDDRFFTRKEMKYLPEVLRDGEQVLGFSSGLMDGHTWVIALTDRRIIFLDKGMIYGLRQTSIDLSKVNAVSGSTGLLLGKISITDGAKERVIENVAKKSVKLFTNMVQAAIESFRSGPPPQSTPQAEDKLSKLEKLADLKAKGILSDSEFQSEKSKILAS